LSFDYSRPPHSTPLRKTNLASLLSSLGPPPGLRRFFFPPATRTYKRVSNRHQGSHPPLFTFCYFPCTLLLTKNNLREWNLVANPGRSVYLVSLFTPPFSVPLHDIFIREKSPSPVQSPSHSAPKPCGPCIHVSPPTLILSPPGTPTPFWPLVQTGHCPPLFPRLPRSARSPPCFFPPG